VDKCARAAEGHDWNSQPAPEPGKTTKPDVDAAAQGSGKMKKKKATGKDKPLARAPTTVAAAASRCHGPHGDKHPWQPSVSDNGGQWCLVHNSKCHNAEECQEIKKLAEQVYEQQKQQQCQDGAPSHQRKSKQKVVLEDDKGEEMEF
jgi:hypothetical protein